MVRFARYWDLVGNSGRFSKTLPRLLGENPFTNFMALSDWLFHTTHQTHRIALNRLFELLHDFMISQLQLNALNVEADLLEDYKKNKLKGIPKFAREPVAARDIDLPLKNTAQRQRRHSL